MNNDHEYDSIMRRGDATEPQIPDGLTFRKILSNYLDAIAGFGAYAALIAAAPEILEAIPESKTTETGVQRRHGGYYCYRCKISADIDIGELNCKSGNNLPEALLKLWLDVRRVEREARNAKHEAT